ncbi:MAG: TonB-dependent receptor [Pseudomonadota bacterium]
MAMKSVRSRQALLGPTCNLPTTLSGDPYLPQIRSTSGELGARGRLRGNWRWNLSAYRTDLHDDIYFVGVADGRSYFDTIGKTRRQGLELGPHRQRRSVRHPCELCLCGCHVPVHVLRIERTQQHGGLRPELDSGDGPGPPRHGRSPRPRPATTAATAPTT